jgi:PhnB protein
MKLAPYLNFAGNAQEALDFYTNALDGQVEYMQRYGDSPMPGDEDYKNKVMHA